MNFRKDNNLFFLNPELCKEWSNKNEFGPEICAPNSDKKVWWDCKKCNNEWEARIADRNGGKGCPYCSGRNVSKENNLLAKNPEICKEWSNKNKSGPENYMPNSCKKVWWKCQNNHEWEAIIYSRNKGRGCPYCAGQMVSKENNLLIKNSELCKDWNYKKNKLDPTNYMPGSNKKVWWICKKCNNEWGASIKCRNNGNGCPYCSGRNASKENNLLAKNPEICEEWSNKNKLGPENYTSSSNQKVLWICKKCNNQWKATINSRNSGNGCPYCSKSVSKSSQQWLDKLGIKIREYRIPYTNYKVDGYDPETNTIYEFYGDKWHGNPNIFNPSDVNPCNKKPYGELYDKTKNRERILKYLGYNLVIIWESDWKAENNLTDRDFKATRSPKNK